MPLQVWVCKTSHCALVCVCVCARQRDLFMWESRQQSQVQRHAHVFWRGKTSKWGSCVPPRPAYCRLPSRKPFSVRTDSLSCWHLLVTKFSTYPCLKKCPVWSLWCENSVQKASCVCEIYVSMSIFFSPLTFSSPFITLPLCKIRVILVLHVCFWVPFLLLLLLGPRSLVWAGSSQSVVSLLTWPNAAAVAKWTQR